MLSAERGEQDLATGDAARARTSLLLGMSKFASGVGLIPEQDWELPDLAASHLRHGSDRRFDPDSETAPQRPGSAAPLTWSARPLFVRLAADLAAGENVALPAATYTRYVWPIRKARRR